MKFVIKLLYLYYNIIIQIFNKLFNKNSKYEEYIKKQEQIHLDNIRRYKEDNKFKTSPPALAKKYEYKTIENKLHYKKKTYLTTKNELKLYKILLDICTKYNLILFTQVVLYEIIEINDKPYSKNYTKYFNKIRSKSIDFVIADKETTRIRLCIELDDFSHKQKKRIDRDEFINTLFKDLDINLLRLPVTNYYDINKIESKIRSTCTDIYY